MEDLHARLLALLTVLAVVLAGCATNDAPGRNDGDSNPVPPTAVSAAEAESMLKRAANATPEKITVRAALTRGSQTLLTMNGTFDNATGVAYVEMKGDPSAFPSGAGGNDEPGADAQFAQVLGQGLVIYMTSTGGLYLVNGTAIVFPANASQASGLIPSPSESPFASILEPQAVLGGLQAANSTVNSVRPTLHRGKPALEVNVSAPDPDGGGNLEALVTLFVNPERIARVEGSAPRTGDGPADPFAGARLAVDFYYEGETRVEPTPAAARAMGLAYQSDRTIFQMDGGPTTWTFLSDGGIPLADVEVQVKDMESQAGMGNELAGVAAMPTLWSMPLSAGNRTQDGVTLTFTDADGDGKVSAGDKLRIETPGDAPPPTVVLYDVQTKTYVVPGPALLAALAGIAVAAFLLRRRG